jgi:hypothetical protein
MSTNEQTLATLRKYIVLTLLSATAWLVVLTPLLGLVWLVTRSDSLLEGLKLLAQATATFAVGTIALATIDIFPSRNKKT